MTEADIAAQSLRKAVQQNDHLQSSALQAWATTHMSEHTALR